jgi:hypothetical protein
MKEMNIDKFYCLSRTVPNWLIWLKYLSWLYYSNEMGLINQWKDVTSLECNQNGNLTCFRNGTDVLNYYGFEQVSKMNIFFLILYCINFFFIESL